MGNSEWDKQLRDLLGDFKSEGETPQWDEFEQQLDSEISQTEDPDLSQDQSLRDLLTNYKVPSEVEGWARIQASLDAADREFDENVRRKIHHYGPQYDPMSWPIFLKRLSASRLLRVKLIAFKVIEASAVLLLLFTVFNMGRLGSFPFDNPFFESKHEVNPADAEDRADLHIQNAPIEALANTESATTESLKVNTRPSQNSNINTAGKNALYGNTLTQNHNEESSSAMSKNTSIVNVEPIATLNEIAENNNIIVPTSSTEEATSTLSTEHVWKTEVPNSTESKFDIQLDAAYITDAIASLDISINTPVVNVIPEPTYKKQPSKGYLEFGIIAQADYNQLRMPEDKLFTSGRQIVFPQEGISSHGFGAGFTIGTNHPLWAVETGIIYSAKDFKPSRQLVVGDVFDNGNVDFEAMRLQILTVPLQYRYRFEPKGRLKAYALAGFGLHVIIQSDIDVLIKYNFPSLSIGENPNQDPNLANTIRETRRISEHFRDGAPFSSKSFLSINAGLGMEYSISQQKTLFLQTALQYQIPNLQFSNNSGKHIRSVSLQAGVRTPLGL